MEDAKEKKLGIEENNRTVIDTISKEDIVKGDAIQNDELKEKILKETYKSIEYDNNCKLIAKEVGKLNTLKVKMRTAFYRVKLFITNAIQDRRNKKYDMSKRKVIIKTNEKCDLDAKTIEVPERRINYELLKMQQLKYQTQEIKRIKGNSGPIFYNLKEDWEKVSNKEPMESEGVQTQNKKYIDIPDISGKDKSQEMER